MPNKGGHWQRGNMHFKAFNVMTEEGVSFNTVSVIAQIDNHLGRNDADHGIVATEQIRFIEVGGICFDWQMHVNSLDLDYTSPPASDIWSADAAILVCSDRLDEAGIPVSIGCDWLQNTTPVNVATSSEPRDLDVKFPTRVHWRHHRVVTGGYFQFPDVTGNGAAPQPVVHLQGSANLRLKLALDDEHVLAFHFCTQIAEAGSALSGLELASTINGSIYYRTRY